MRPGAESVRPNTLRDEMAPNTFRPRVKPGIPGSERAPARGAMPVAAPVPPGRRRIQSSLIVAGIVLALGVLAYLAGAAR
jgi:hypothetical protein